MGKLDLQLAFGGRSPLAENFEDQAGAVDHLCADLLLQVLLLHRREWRIDDQQSRVMFARETRDFLDLPLTQQGRGTEGAEAKCAFGDDDDANRLGESLGLPKPRLG